MKMQKRRKTPWLNFDVLLLFNFGSDLHVPVPGHCLLFTSVFLSWCLGYAKLYNCGTPCAFCSSFLILMNNDIN